MTTEAINTLSTGSITSAATPGSDTQNTARASVLETRNNLINQFASVSHISSENTNWIGIQDSIYDGFISLSMVQISDEGLEKISQLLNELKTEFSGTPDQNRLKELETEISTLVGEYTILQTDTRYILGPDADSSKDQDLVTYKDYADLLQLGSDSAFQDFLVLEINTDDVVNAYHSPDGCAICQAQANALNNTDANTVTASTVLNMAATSSTADLANSVPVASGTNYIDSLILGSTWDDSSGDPLTWSVYNGTAGYDAAYYAGVAYDDSADTLSAANIANVAQAFDLWDAASDLAFEQVTESSSEVGDLRVAYSNTMPLNTSTADPNDRAAAFALSPFGTPQGGDIWFDSGVASGYTVNQNLNPGTYGFLTALHEFGHAIGLSHPFGGESASGASLPGADDIKRNTVMSYTGTDRNLTPTNFVYDSSTGSYSWSYSSVQAVTPMLYDVAAVEYLYGTSTDTETGNTTHTASSLGFSTIVDSSGIDTLDASSESTSSTINLTAGSFSSIGTTTLTAHGLAGAISLNTNYSLGLSDAQITSLGNSLAGAFSADTYLGQDNVAIAYSAVIENAKGGSGDDTITGANGVDNAIEGGAGDDVIDGLGGTDTAVYSGNLADYTITHNGDGTITVTDNNTADGLDEGSDTLSNIEAIEFADQTYDTASQTSSATLTSAMISGTPAAGITPGTSTATGSSGSGSSGGSGGSSDPHGYGALFGVGGSTALAMIDKAIDTVSLERAKLGAILNRLDSRKSSLLSEMENTKSSISKIQDADFAMETARLIKEQIRQKVASAMLSYANSSMQQLTKLLK